MTKLCDTKTPTLLPLEDLVDCVQLKNKSVPPEKTGSAEVDHGKTKQCSACKKIRTLNEFSRRSEKKDGLSNQCKICSNLRERERRSKNHIRHLLKQREWRHKNIEQIRKKALIYDRLDRCVKRRKNNFLKRKYGITSEQYQNIFNKQNGVCAVCGKPQAKTKNGKTISLYIDHCHKTGNIRGLLCNLCNVAIGLVRDDLRIIHSMEKYLQKSKGMKISIRKHVQVKNCTDMFLVHDIDFDSDLTPMLGQKWKTCGAIEIVTDVIVDDNTGIVQIWMEPDKELMEEKIPVSDLMDKLAIKIREYQNRGWNVL